MSENNDAEILFSTHSVPLRSGPVTVREFTLDDSMALYGEIESFVAELNEIMTGDQQPNTDTVRGLLARNRSRLHQFIAQATDRSPQWVARLPGQDGSLLLDWWWAMNRDFFINAVYRRQLLDSKVANRPVSD